MTSKEYQSAKFIDLHGHNQDQKACSSEDFCIYSYSPKINDLPMEGRFYSAGVHPWQLTNAKESFEEISKLCKSNNCLLVGEAGLDRAILKDTESLSLHDQEEVFIWHINLAMELNQPLIIHNVRCLSDIFRLHKSFPKHGPWILHDFNGSYEDTLECIKRGIFMSLGPRFYESSNAKIARAVAHNKLDLDYIFFETDERRDIKVQEIYQQFAKLQKIELSYLKERVWKNLEALLGSNLTI